MQAALSAGIVLLGVFAERLVGHELGRREWIGIALAATGLAFLALSGGAKDGQETADYSVVAMIAFESGLVAIGVALLLSRRGGRVRERQGVLLRVAAGLLFTVTHVAIKAATGKVDTSVGEVLATPWLPLAVAGGVGRSSPGPRSLQIRPAVPVIAVTSVAGNASAIPAGVVVFGDPLGGDAWLVVLRGLAFLLVTAAVVAIRRRPERRTARAGPRPSPRREAVLRPQ